MEYLKSLRLLAFSFAIFLVSGTYGLAQKDISTQQKLPEVNENFTEEEYKSFANINIELIPIQENVQERIVKTIEDKGLSVERFQQLAQAQQAGTIREVAADAEEMAKFNNAGQEVMSIQKEIQLTVLEIIEKSDLSPEKFQEMYMAYNQSEKVRNKVDELIEKEIDN